MKEILVVAVGRIKTPHWQAAVNFYLKRISFSARVEIKIVKDADADLPMQQRVDVEAQRIVSLVPSSHSLTCLDERGKSFTSQAFATFLSNLQDTGKPPCFVLGGAFGLGSVVKERAAHTLALGTMTFPHELARVLLLEQIYRAQTISAGTGYHH